MRRSIAALLVAVAAASAGTTIDSAHRHAYGANIGWINARGDGANGAAIGASYCTGYLWSANCGWIGLGNGPANGHHYGNASADDWGVNHDGAGQLTGRAYGANIGWITFEQTHGQPRVDLRTGNLSGFAWGANVGWISLAHAEGYVRTERLDAGPDTDGDGLPDAWELGRTNRLTALDGRPADADNDGTPDVDEYRADTNPFDAADRLKIVGLQAAGSTNIVRWAARPTRLYRLEATNAVAARGSWPDAGGGLLGPPAGQVATARVSSVTGPAQFYRVQAVVPLSE